MICIKCSHALAIFIARLMRHTQMHQKRLWQHSDCGRDNVAQNPRALRTANHQKRHRVWPRGDISSPRALKHSATYGIACVDTLNAFRQCGRPSAARHNINPLGKNLIHTAQDTVLFMDHTWLAQKPCRRHRRDTRIAAKADHNSRLVTQHLEARGQDAAQNPKRNQKLGQGPAARKSRGGHLFNLNRVRKTARVARTTRIGAQLNTPARTQHPLRKSLRRKHVSTCSARSNNQQRFLLTHLF